MKKILYEFAGRGIWLINYITFKFKRNDKETVIFDTAKQTENLGDFVIMGYCNHILRDLFPGKGEIHISTHVIPHKNDEKKVQKSKYKFVCGTNLLTSTIEKWWNWRLPDGFKRKLKYRNAILFGVGWGNYQDECSDYSRFIYRALLNPCVLHSVRDSYTEEKLKAAGIKNVINTGCPTMWRLNRSFCESIPVSKAPDVVTTVTDYRREIERDNLMLQILGRNYRKVYLWLQGNQDQEYIKQLNLPGNCIVLTRNLKSFEEKLQSGFVDYVGTRLHAGIYALNHRVRSIIIAVDNRAIEIAKDTNLPMVMGDKLYMELEAMLSSDFRTDITLNIDNIHLFLEQFRKKGH